MLLDKIKEVSLSVIPITMIVLILHFFFVPLSNQDLLLFIIGALFVLLGLALFLFGVDVSINPIGNVLGVGVTQKNNLWLLIIGGLLIGFTGSVAEPALTILGSQIEEMSGGLLSGSLVVLVVAAGVGIFLTIGILRIAYRWNISKLVTIFYGIIFIFSIFADEVFFTFAFDSSGATTGALTIPFILAISAGMVNVRADSQSEEFNFGLVGISSIGPIFAMLMLDMFLDIDLSSSIPVVMESSTMSIWQSILQETWVSFLEVLIGILPILVIFFIYHLFIERQSKRLIRDICVGLIYLVLGLTLFLSGVASGFMPITQILGSELYLNYSAIWPILIGFILGIVAILAEPAIYVLIEQVETITGGTISKKMVLVTISLGVGLAIALTIIRMMVPWLRLWHILLPGFGLSIILSWFVPKLFVGLAFDSGGVASGPMTGTFIFAFVQGIALSIPDANVIVDGFGMIAVVAMTPILFIEILGFIYYMAEKRQID